MLSTLDAKAQDTNLFSYNAADIENQMAQLNSLESYLDEHPGSTFSQLEIKESFLSPSNSDLSNPFAINFIPEDVLGVPSFAWGCCFGVAGVLIVVLVGEDKEETKKALQGCVVSTGVTTVAYVAYYVIYASQYL